MKRIERLRLDINKEDSFNIVNFKQNDTCDLIIDIYKDGIVQDVSNQIINFYVKKPDNTFVEQTTGISATGNVVTINVDEQVVTREGRAYGEITLRDDNGKMTSSCFIINVGEQKVNINDLIESSDKIAILDEIRDFIEQSRRDIEEYKATIRDLDERVAENDAKINGLNEKIEEIDINIDEVKEQALTEMDNKHREVVETISNANEALKEAKEQALTDINAEKDNTLNTVEEKQTEAVEAIESTKNESVEEINAIKTELQDLNRVAQNTKVQLKAEHTTAENRREALQEVVDSANAINELLLSTKEEASNKEIDLSELINTVNTLIRTADSVIESLRLENIHAEENMNELNPLNVEADENIEELKRLIQQAIDIAIPALKAYIAEHTPAEDLTQVNQQLEELYNAVRELDVRFNNYYTKEEVDKKFSDIKGLEVKGFIGESLQFPPVEAKFANMVIPEEQLSNYPEIKHTFTYKQSDSSNTYFKRVFFFCDLNNTDDGKYLSFDGRYIQFHNITPDDYVMVQCATSASNPTPNPRPYTLTALDCLELKNRVHGFDFNLYNPEGTAIIENDPSKSGIGDFNQATEDGFYTINTTASGFSTLMNAPAFTPSEDVKGILKVIGGNQTLDITSEGVIFEREQNGLWNNTLDKAIKKEAVGSITSDVKTITPAFFKSLPPDARYFFKNKQRLLFRSRENTYVAMRFATTAEKCNITYNMGRNELYISAKKEVIQTDVYDATTGEWSTEIRDLSSAYGELTVLKDYFVVYENTMTIKYGGGTIYQEPTIAKFDGTPTINNFNNATEVGVYNVDIKADDTIENAPCEGAIAGVLKVSKAEKTICQELIKDTNNVYIRTLINDGWTQWKESGATVDLSGYYNKQETDNKIDEKISAIDMSNYYNKTEIDAKLVKEIGVIKSGDPSFKEPVWDTLPENTFINIPANPDPDTYLWEMKCSHYGYHMVFYFPTDPTGKFGIVQRADGKLGFKLLDSSFKYKEYKSYYKEKNSSTKWNNMPSDNHFTNPDSRILEAMYSHNFDIVDGNNPSKVFRYGSQNDFGAEFIKDFNEATELELYSVNATGEGVIENSPITGAYKGILRVLNINGLIHQTLETTKGESCKRLCVNGKWTEWSREAEFEIEPEQYSERNGEYITNSLIELYNGNLRFEYGEYIVDEAKNSQHVENPTKEYTDLIMLKAGGFKQVLGCMVFPHKLDFHYSMYCNINMVLVDPNNKPDCMRLYIGYLGDRNEAFHPINGLGKVKYCVFGY